MVEAAREQRDREQTQPSQRETTRRPEQQREALTRRPPSGFGLLSREPFSLMNALRREIDKTFGNFGFGGLQNNIWSPEVELFEKDGKLHVSADLPGLNKNDVHIEVNDNMLTIEGERRSERSDEKGGWTERTYGRFSRSIPLPEGVNTDTAKARFENGVLDIELDTPRVTEKHGKSIPIR